ncbi:host cell division inhibitor Icd-like protein [Salmonella enterica subsp. enterica serovar Muenchen]|nr:host cell division inhibitor Icd-like protein [Salmonella enterica subsp. enterica serovar Muenchen]
MSNAYPALHKTGAGRGNPKLSEAIPDAESVFFVVCYMCHSMAWYAKQQGSYNRRSPAILSYHATNNGAVCSPYDGLLSGIRSRNSTSRRQRMVTLAGQPQGWPVPLYAGIATPVNVTAPVECGNSSGDSVNVRGGRLMATTPAQNMLFVWRFWSVLNSTYLTTTAASEREARSQLPAVIARIRMEVQHDA